MTRGIHLKQLKNADLTALGLEEGRLPPETEARGGGLAETDPALSQLVCDVREGLERTLELLKCALEGTEGGKT
jgi:hypothetical protein